MYSGKRKVPIDVWGVCVSRDIFGIVSDYFLGDGDMEINYFRATSFMAQMSPHVGPDLSAEDFYGVTAGAERFSHKSSITAALRDYNKTLLGEMAESGSRWLVVDGVAEAHGLYRITFADGGQEYISAELPDRAKAVSEILTAKGVKHELELIGTEYPDRLYKESLSKMADFLRDRYGDRIILVEASGSEAYLNAQCEIEEFKKKGPVRGNERLRSFEDDFSRLTGCRRLRQPRFIVSDYYHKWGGVPSPVHFVEEYYWYAFRVISLYFDEDEDAEGKADRMCEECGDRMLAFRNGSEWSVSNVIGYCRRLVKARRYKEAQSKLRRLSDAGEPRAMAMLGEMRIRGLGTLYNVNGGMHMFAAAFRAGYLPAANQLFDLVVDTGPYNTAFGLVRRAALLGCRSSMARLAIAFMEGKGTERNVRKAAYWFDRAMDSGKLADRYMVFDTVWRLGGKECDGKMASLVVPLVQEDREAKVRMGMAYEAGRGVEEDLTEASRLYDEAATMGTTPAANRLFDLVWGSASAEQYAYVAQLVRKFALSGDTKAMWRLGRAYRFGKGVEKDLALANEFCDKAFKRVLPAAGNEIFLMLKDEGTAEALEEMRALATRQASKGEFWAYRALGMMHLRGKGVERNLSKALKYARMAAEEGSVESYGCLLDVLWEISTGEATKEMRSIVLEQAGKDKGWAHRRLGLMYLHGRGVDRDVGEAAACMRKAIGKGTLFAYEDLFRIFWESESEEELSELMRAIGYYVSRDEGWAHRIQGLAYSLGVDGERDVVKAAECHRAAVDRGDRRSLPDMCDVLLEIGTEEALEEMAALVSRYAGIDEPWALNRMANALLHGIGMDADAKAGAEMHLRAIGLGSAESARDLYDYARSARKADLVEKAIAALRYHAERDDPDCMMRLGRMHWEGYGAPYDRVAGMEWMQAAAALSREYRQELGSLAGEADAEAEDERRPPANVYLCSAAGGRGCAHVQEEDSSEDPRAFHRSEERLRVADRGALRQQAFPGPLRGV